MRPFLLALLVGLALPAAAQPAADGPATWNQTARGVRIVGGSGYLTRYQSRTSATLAPRLGLYVADGLALSAALQLGYSRFSDEISGTSSFAQIGVGPAVTYSIGGPGAAVRPFAEADLSVTYSRHTNDLLRALGGDVPSTVTVGGGLGAGVEVPIARNVAVQAQAFYRTSDLSFDDETSFYGLSVGFSTFIY